MRKKSTMIIFIVTIGLLIGVGIPISLYLGYRKGVRNYSVELQKMKETYYQDGQQSVVDRLNVMLDTGHMNYEGSMAAAQLYYEDGETLCHRIVYIKNVGEGFVLGLERDFDDIPE